MTTPVLRVLQVAGLVPVVALVACAAIYVVTGGDPLPGHEGNRWITLTVLAMSGGTMALFVGLEVSGRADR